MSTENEPPEPAEMEEREGAEPSFSQAMAELEQILRGIEGDEVDIDLLANELARAARLLEVCRAKIRKAEVEIAQVVHQLDDTPPS